MNELDTLKRIIQTPLILKNLKWCFADDKKLPYTWEGRHLRPNEKKDFCSFTGLLNKNLMKFKGMGISVNFSNIAAVDVDKCFSVPFDISSGDDRCYELLDMFRDFYVEFSFSGTGLRILFDPKRIIDDYPQQEYLKTYYIKNPWNRYVTVTGNFIFNNDLKEISPEKLSKFLDKYMKKREIEKKESSERINNILDINEAEEELRKLLIKNPIFQENWYQRMKKNESETDYYLLKMIYDNISQDRNIVKKLFESSFYFSAKDRKHKNKWNNTSYFETTFRSIERRSK